jgi:lipopolysaccharide heptosyltransferase II
VNNVLKILNQNKLKLAIILDKTLTFIFGGLRNSYTSPISNPKRIVVVQSHLIGDLIMATPMLRALKKAYPDAVITLVANEFATELLQGQPYVDMIITMKFPWSTYDYSMGNIYKVFKVIKRLRACRFDLAIDAQIDMRNAFLLYIIGAKRRLGYDITGCSIFLTDVPQLPNDKDNFLEIRLSLLDYLSIDTSDKKTLLLIEKQNKDWVDSYLLDNNLNKNKVVGIHPGASVKEKLWQPEEFKKVIDFLNDKGYHSVIIEGPADNKIVDAIISLCNNMPLRLKTNLKNVIAFISTCRLLVCMDSGVAHIAGAVGTPIIVLYGPQPPEICRPLVDNIEVIWDESSDCRPCEYGKCKNISHRCMDAIKAETVISKIIKQVDMLDTRQ